MPPQLVKVAPGDLITAAQFNDIIDSLNSALARIAALEAGGGTSTSGLVITDLVPAGPYRVGQTIQIVGKEFQFAIGATRVFFGSTQVFNLRPTSTDSLLEFEIPVVAGVTEAGTEVDLTVANQTDSDTRKVILRPRQTSLQGFITTTFLSVTPATIAPGQPALFRYRLTSGANAAASYLVTPTISGSPIATALQGQLSVLDANQTAIPSRQISVDPGSQVEFFVRIGTVPTGTAGQTFNLTVNVGADSLNTSTGAQQFPIGSPAEQPDPLIALAPVPGLSGAALSGNTLTVPAGNNRLFGLAAVLDQPPGVDGPITYALGWQQGAGSTGWTVALLGGATGATSANRVLNPGDFVNGEANRSFQYTITAATGASATGSVTFTMQRQGESRVVRYTLSLVRGL